jgi:mannitol-specific phosphotransferase system IIBC component
MKKAIQRSGGFLTGMILPTNGVFIALGLKMDNQQPCNEEVCL